MTPGMKMVMLKRARSGREMQNAYGGMENRNGMENQNGMENRYAMAEGPMNRGYKRYKNGRFAPHNGGEEMGMEMGSRGGRVMPIRDERDDGVRNAYNGAYGGMEDRYGMDNRFNGMEGKSRNAGTGYRYDGGGNRMIGFTGGEMQSNYRMDASHENRNEMEHRTSTKKPGHSGSDVQPMTREKAQKWVQKMKNADGSTGEHWSFDQTYQLMKQRNIDCEPAEFYAVMNMLWSDYGKVAEKFGVSNMEYWAELAKAFLMDKDAEEEKLTLYYECIVKK